MGRLAAIALGLLVTTACTTEVPPSPQTMDVSGVWIGDWAFEPAGTGHGIFTATLSQNGTEITGAVQLTGQDRKSPTPVTGVVQGDEIHFSGVAASGVLRVTGNELSGTLRGDGPPARVIARRQRAE